MPLCFNLPGMTAKRLALLRAECMAGVKASALMTGRQRERRALALALDVFL